MTILLLSPVLRGAVKAFIQRAGVRQYELALRSGYAHPNLLSAMLHGGVRVRQDDPRIAALCRLVNCPLTSAFIEVARDERAIAEALQQ